MNQLAIQTTNLVKTFGPTRALDGFSLSVEAGTVAGFLGPNGAGKSTAIRVLLGVLRADAGTARVLGLDPWADAVAIHRRIAYVPGDTSLWPNLTGGEAIDIFTRLNNGSRDTGSRGGGQHGGLEKRRGELLERFELDPTKKARTYSKGNRQKVALVAALASDADLFLLDEPTSGLDPLMEAVFTDEIRSLREQGRTVLLSSHILAEVEKLCDTVTIIRAGRDVETGTLAQLRHLTRSTVTATTTADPAALAAAPGVHNLSLDDGYLRFDVDNASVTDVLLLLAGDGTGGRYADSNGTGGRAPGVQNLTISPPSLEELFLRHYGDAVPAEGGVR
ncbi:ATP-binding cassette domain-containing protein [Arthrobacter jiangjiafuii]|uniref:ATP-binding cassette domain-containing protein n=1 Tax=Arthrobacter jiangjiafuii TaxID=2817475 RepID=A0A975M4X3_9MICC|nr:ATP-binding cassette domain-containing protein [Arthrobacter jiangjiafuii]MBP3042314.1 ATP-binding cassette domain-containing protein [Arthrobacter jiangjiafuii]QWC09930.1 ATP-binding cassette domain-containing protein [Arthrobacter jiangjiafuii]